MTLWFQSILAVVLALLCIFLFLLFRQLKYTAIAIRQLAESAKNDLRQVSDDIHSLRVHTDKLLDFAANNLDLPLNVNSLFHKITQTMHAFLDKKSFSWLEVILTNVKFINKFISKSKKTTDYR